MTFSPLMGARWPLGTMPNGGPRSSSRLGVKVDMFIVHHAAGGDAALRGAYVARGRELSSTYAITNDGTIAGVLTEDLRPFTSSTYLADGRAVTAEVANSAIGDASGWPVSDAAFHALARLIADCATRHGFPIKRGTKADPRGVIGHREVLPFFGKGVATACPGGIWPRMDELVELALAYQRAAIDTPANQTDTEEFPAMFEIINHPEHEHGIFVCARGTKPIRTAAERASLEQILTARRAAGPGRPYDVGQVNGNRLRRYFRMAW